MSKTTFSSKCEILGSLWLWHKDTDNETWAEFFTWSDVGLPIAYFTWRGYISAKEEGKKTVEETWRVFCEMIEIDPEAKYLDLNDAFDKSPNDPLT